MIKQVYVCDCCGKDITEGFYRMDVAMTDKTGARVGDGPIFDLCHECFQKFTEGTIRPIKNDEPKEKPKKKPEPQERKTVDAGKIGALYDAGWPTKEIAAEMGVSIPTVLKYINKHKKEIGGE